MGYLTLGHFGTENKLNDERESVTFKGCFSSPVCYNLNISFITQNEQIFTDTADCLAASLLPL